jgi:FkbM family methyltransferase
MQAFPEWVAGALRPYPFRGKLRLLDPLVPRAGRRWASVFEARMELDLTDPIQRNIFLGAYEPRETALVRKWLRPGMTFVDVGANVGYFTALAASLVGPTGRVFAIEPQPRVHRQLERMIVENSLKQVRSLCAGLSDIRGEIPLYLPVDPGAGQNATMVAHSGALRVTVPVTTLDTCMEEWGIEQVDLLKIDVEGHEPQVFRGASSALRRRRIRATLCEFNEPWLRQAGRSASELYQMLRAEGFEDIQGDPSFTAPVMNRFLYLKI